MQYDLTDLRLFVAIAEAKNLTRGAERVHLAASSASHRLRQLEASIGTPLLLREPRGVSLWANTHATHTFLPDSLSSFLQRHPQVSISLEEHTSPHVLMAVARGEVEVGVVAGTIADAEVELIPYRADRLVLIAPVDHPLAAHVSSLFAQVLDYPFVMLHSGSAIHTFTMNAAAALGRHLEVRIQVRSFEAVCRMVSAGVGIGMVPRSAVTAGAPLAVIELEEPWAQRDLKVCVRKRELLSGFAAELVDCLTASSTAG